MTWRTSWQHPIAPGKSARSLVACGPALPLHAFEVRDEAGKALPERRIGRIFFKGPSVMTGYFRQPELTAEALSADGWLDTGDLGYLLNGEVVITGRAKDLIIINGRNIWPQDLEWTAETLPDLRRGDAAAFSVVGDDEQEQVVVLVQCRISDLAARTKLTQDIAGLLQRSMGVEARVHLVPPKGLPQTSSGKLSAPRQKPTMSQGRLCRCRSRHQCVTPGLSADARHRSADGCHRLRRCSHGAWPGAKPAGVSACWFAACRKHALMPGPSDGGRAGRSRRPAASLDKLLTGCDAIVHSAGLVRA